MNRNTLAQLILFTLIAGALLPAAGPSNSLANPEGGPGASSLEPGVAAPDFTLKDSTSVEHSLQSLLKGSKLVIVDFWSTKCPFSRGYEDKLKAIAGDYEGKGVKVLAVMSNQTEGPEDVRQYLEKTPLPYPVVIDPGSKVADRFGAQTTPHIFVLDPSGTIRYVGAIDNGAKEPAGVKPYLRQALDALLAGQAPPEARTRNFGCSIKRKA